MAEVRFQTYWSKTQQANTTIATGVLITPSEGIRSALTAHGANAKNAARGSLYRAAETIMAKAKRLTPVDYGNLQASGHVQPAKIEGNGVVVTMGFGGPAGIGNQSGTTNKKDVGYAIVVHETHGLSRRVMTDRQRRAMWASLNERFNGDKKRIEQFLSRRKDPNRGRKYLERPVLEFAPQFEEWLAKDLRREFARVSR